MGFTAQGGGSKLRALPVFTFFICPIHVVVVKADVDMFYDRTILCARQPAIPTPVIVNDGMQKTVAFAGNDHQGGDSTVVDAKLGRLVEYPSVYVVSVDRPFVPSSAEWTWFHRQFVLQLNPSSASDSFTRRASPSTSKMGVPSVVSALWRRTDAF